MASNYTENHGLCQWEATDQVLRKEFNKDNIKIDETLKALTDRDADLERAVTAIATAAGNCEMELITYTGTGIYGNGTATRINFSVQPEIFIVVGDQAMLIGQGNNGSALCIDVNVIFNQLCSWNGATLSIINGTSAHYQMNSQSKPYWGLGLRRKV